MNVTVDTTQLERLDGRLTRAGRFVSDRQVVGRALKKAGEPVLNRLRVNTPVGPGNERISLRRSTRRGYSSNAYRQGGATRRDARLKVVAGKGNEVARLLAGIDKRRGKVGWRTPFTTRGTRDRYTKTPRRYVGRVRANDFLGRTERETLPGFVADYGQTMSDQVERILTTTT
ncbi:hypothetical protein DYU11_19950 [Fibrisoma montanum]|uniref:Uncharacterized protein n=1 Tax=Fibrisoma montanum TaxID=2305895 RepID=A0A418M3B7_9BACT|nr:hypothetical protein [Fibrisoma montanum]RIV20327.1 hypothetical protein DYU11_19950 [Fibrisoma montanum]